MLNNIEHYDLYKILKNYRENKNGPADDERLIGKHLKKAIEKADKRFTESGLICIISGELILEPARIVYDDDTLSIAVYEYSKILQWMEEKGTCPLTREHIKEFYLDEEIKQTIQGELRKCFNEYCVALLDKLIQSIQNNDYDNVLKYLNDCVDILDINAKNNQGKTALHYAALANNPDIVELLLEKGADIDAQDNKGQTALHYAALANNTDTVELLLEKGADIDAQDNKGQTALHYAALANNPDIVKLLLEKGAKTDIKDNQGQAALHYAALDNTDIVELLLEKGADIDAQDNKGQTALHYAANNPDIVKLLLEKGAKHNTEDYNGKKPLFFAKNKKIITLLKNKQIIESASQNDYDNMLKYLNDCVDILDINAKNNQGKTALHYAAKYNRADIVKLLLDKGAKTDIKDNEGKTALHTAFDFGRKHIAKLLLENGADIDTQDNKGQTALHFASARGCGGTVRFLLEQGAKTDIKDNEGKTPLSSTQDKAIIKLLKKKQIIETTTSFVKERPSNRIASIVINIIQRTPYTPFGPL